MMMPTVLYPREVSMYYGKVTETKSEGTALHSMGQQQQKRQQHLVEAAATWGG
jgi:hypothetical protein